LKTLCKKAIKTAFFLKKIKTTRASQRAGKGSLQEGMCLIIKQIAYPKNQSAYKDKWR
jgi:hypothetical protein